MSELTIKQENFCQKYVECGNASQAYRHAFSCEKMKPETINVKASELLKVGKITVRVRELKQIVSERAIATKEDKLRRLEEIMNDNLNKPNEVISAIKVHNEMTGDNAPTKTEIIGADGAPLIPRTMIDLHTLPKEKLERMLEVIEQ